MIETYNMKGGGFYNANSTPQLSSIEGCLPWLLDELDKLPLPADKQVRTLDVGCSEGGNSVFMLQRLVNKLRERGAKCIQPSLADLPTNDFRSVASKLFPEGESVFGGNDVLPAMLGGSAYEQLVPDQSLHIVTTFNMLGWRATPPVGPLRHTIGSFMPTPFAPPHEPTPDPAEVAAVHDQGKPDLVRFFRARAKELVPGGKMLVHIFGNNDDGGSVAHGWMDALNDVLREMVAAGKCTQQAYDDFIFPVVWRTLAELLEPLKEHEDLHEAFTIEKAESWEVPVDFHQRLAIDGDVQTWARQYTNTFRAVTETTLSNIFPEEHREVRMEETYTRVEELFISDPERYQFHYYSIAVLVTRN